MPKQKRTIEQLYEIFSNALNRWYVGKGLFVTIDELTLVAPAENACPGDQFAEYYDITGRYGRCDPDGDQALNFQYNFDMTYTDNDSDDFLCGMFYQNMCMNEREDA